MATAVPTLENESIEEFLEALEKALAAFMATVVYPITGTGINNPQPWCLDRESTTGDAVVAEARFDEGTKYTQVNYSRDPATGEFLFTNPFEVREHSTFVPVEQVSPPPVGLGLSRVGVLGVSLEALPVTGEYGATEALTVGKPVQLLREGPIFDVVSGKYVMTVTAELCNQIATTAKKLQMPIPVDFGHALYNAQVNGAEHSEIPLFGRISALEARPGEGLWGIPEWTPRGVEFLTTNPGIMYLSPTLMPAPFDPVEGVQMPGNGLHSVSLTPTPRQNSLAPVALAARPNTQEVEAVDEPVIAPEAAPTAEVTALAIELNAHKSQIEALKLAVEQRDTEIAGLREFKLNRDFDDLFNAADARGVVLSATLKDTLKAVGLDKAEAILSNMSGERPIALGHSRVVAPAEPESPENRELRIIELARLKNISLVTAAQELSK